MGHRHLCFVLSLGRGLGLALVFIAATAHAGGGHARGAGAITAQKSMDNDGGVGSRSMMRSMVGSRPPSCAGRCWWCGARRCEAVQVPITPQEHHGSDSGRGGGGRGEGASPSEAEHQHRQRPSTSSSYDDHSNYKPLSWRCKCGGG